MTEALGLIAKYMRDLSNVAGDAKLFHLDEPLDTAEYVAVSVINAPRWNQVVTHVIPSFESGASWSGPDGSLSMFIEIPPVDGVPLSHEAALASLGYEADWTPWPEPEPTFKTIRAVQDFSVADPQGNVLTVTKDQVVALPIPVADGLIGEALAVPEPVVQ